MAAGGCPLLSEGQRKVCSIAGGSNLDLDCHNIAKSFYDVQANWISSLPLFQAFMNEGQSVVSWPSFAAMDEISKKCGKKAL